MSYPEVQQIYTTTSDKPDPLSSFATLTGTFDESMPDNRSTISEAAYDLWTNYSSDIMVWNEVVGRCNTGAFGSTKLATGVSISGQRYNVYRYGGAGAEIIFVLQGRAGGCATESSGTVDILGVLNWVNSNVTSITGITQIDYGWEICSTGGIAEPFNVSAYTLTDTCTPGAMPCR